MTSNSLPRSCRNCVEYFDCVETVSNSMKIASKSMNEKSQSQTSNCFVSFFFGEKYDGATHKNGIFNREVHSDRLMAARQRV